MLLQLAWGGEALGTDGAHEGLLARVGAHMRRHIMAGKPGNTKQNIKVRLLYSMHGQIYSQL